jgi:hypothetical protein
MMTKQPMSDRIVPTPAEMIEQYVKLRNTKNLIEAEQKEALKPYAEALESIELALLDYLNEAGIDNVKSKYGTAFKKATMTAKMADRQAVIAYCKETNNFDLFTNNLTKETVKEYLEANGTAPPGVEIFQFTVVQVRKA